MKKTKSELPDYSYSNNTISKTEKNIQVNSEIARLPKYLLNEFKDEIKAQEIEKSIKKYLRNVLSVMKINHDIIDEVIITIVTLLTIIIVIM